MQIGALGFIFVLSSFFLIIKRKLSFKETINIGAALGTPEDLKNLRPLIKRILRFTIVVEFVGMIILAFRFIPMFGIRQGLLQSLFTSVSGFCNCGFDILGNNSLISYGQNSDYLVLGTVAALTVFGGLGFIVWNEIYEKIKRKKETKVSSKKIWLMFGTHSKIVITMTLVMILFGTLIFFAIEKDNNLTIGEHTLFDKIFISMFHGISARTTGMAAFNLSDMTTAGKFFTIILMAIGGAPGGTAGGIKIVTLAVLVLTAISYASKNKNVNVFKREITNETIKLAITILVTAILIVSICTIIISVQNPEIPFMDVLFEVTSSVATCGYSLGITSSLTISSKIILIMLMFIGRVSTVTMTIAIAGKRFKENNLINYPKADIKL